MHPITMPAQPRVTALAAAFPLAVGWALHTALYRRRLEAARRDPLTNLPARELFTARAEKLIHHPDATVLVIDLDKFKQVNDAFGHQAGDAVLFAAAHWLELWTDRAGVAGRIGGDEFAAILTIPKHQLADRLTALTHGLSDPMTWQGRLLPRGASVGAVRVADLDRPATLGAAMKAADTAMYAAKLHAWGWEQWTPGYMDTAPHRWRRNRPDLGLIPDGAASDWDSPDAGGDFGDDLVWGDE